MRKALALAFAFLPFCPAAHADEPRLPIMTGIGLSSCRDLLQEQSRVDTQLTRLDLAAWTQGFISAQNLLTYERNHTIVDMSQIDNAELYTHTFRYCSEHADQRIIYGVLDYAGTLGRLKV